MHSTGKKQLRCNQTLSECEVPKGVRAGRGVYVPALPTVTRVIGIAATFGTPGCEDYATLCIFLHLSLQFSLVVFSHFEGKQNAPAKTTQRLLPSLVCITA